MFNADLPASVPQRIARTEAGVLPTIDLLSDAPHPATIAERLTFHRVPGLSLAVIADYQVAWARGYGVRTAGTSAPVTPATRFQAASISKPIAAAAALRLVAEDRLELDADVNDYLTSWKVPANGRWQPRVTLRQLLCHSAGLTVHGFPGYARGDSIPTLRQVLDGHAPANTSAIRVNILPGVQSRYSGGGYCVLQQLLIDVTGLEFAELMRSLVLEPVGMVHSTYEQPLPAVLHDSAAIGHEMRGRGAIPGGWHVYPEQAAAGLWTTAADVARFLCELALARLGRSARLLPQELAAEMLSPQVAPQNGLGLFLGGEGEAAYAGHSGWNEGYICDATLFPQLGIGAVAMTNGQNGFDLIPEVLRAVAQEYGWPNYLQQLPSAISIEPQLLVAAAGDYQLKTGAVWSLRVAGGALELQPAAQPPIKMAPKSKTEFFATAVNAEITLQIGDNGAVIGFTLQQNDQQITAVRCEIPA
jgi:CubicO group peptidase (beta-lactamase class C family)